MKRFLMLSVFSFALMNATSLFAEEVQTVETDTKMSTEKEASSVDEESLVQKVLARMPKISGYFQTGWNYTTKDAGTSTFQAKRLRMLVDGNVAENVSFRLQLECFNGIAGSTNGNGQKNIQVMDAFATAKITPEFQIRAGQFYLPLGYENYDISPATLETVDFSNICYRMVCRNAIAYHFVDYGRDLGVMLLGNLLPDDSRKFNHLSYALSLTNGSLQMKDDNNKSKDLVASLTFRPIEKLSIKGSFNWGEYAGAVDTVTYKNQPMSRYIVGAWYNDPAGLVARTEYGHIQSTDNNIKIVKEDGFYVLVGYHINKFLPVVRYDMYRDKVNKTSANNYDRVLAGLAYQAHKNIKLQVNYNHAMYTDEAKEVSNHGVKSADQIQVMGIFKF